MAKSARSRGYYGEVGSQPVLWRSRLVAEATMAKSAGVVSLKNKLR